MKMFVVRAGEKSQHREINIERKIATIRFNIPIDLNKIHDIDTALHKLEDNARLFGKNPEMLYKGYKTEAGRRTIAVELLTFAHNIEKGDLIFTPDSRKKIL